MQTRTTSNHQNINSLSTNGLNVPLRTLAIIKNHIGSVKHKGAACIIISTIWQSPWEQSSLVNTI